MKGKYTYRGFSLIEMLAVMAVIIIMTAMLLPAISGFGSTMGRRGAVNVLMNGFELARVAALESGSKVYVVMRRNENVGEPDAFCVLRARSDSLNDPVSPSYVRLTRWQKLPTSVLFYQAAGSLTITGKDLPSELVSSLAGAPSPSELFGVAFNRTGQIVFPATGDVNLFLAEGNRVGQNQNAIAHGPSLSITERLSFRRYTGRAQLDFTAPPQS